MEQKACLFLKYPLPNRVNQDKGSICWELMDVFKSPVINKVQLQNLVQGASNVMGIKQMLTHADLNLKIDFNYNLILI